MIGNSHFFNVIYERMIKNLIFDMGQVLIHWDPEQIMYADGVTDKEDMALINKYMYHTSDWSLMDWGYVNEEKMEKLARERLPERLWDSVHKLLFGWYDHIYPMEGMATLIKDYKEMGLNIYLLSNASSLLHEYFPHIPGSEYFTDKVVSADVKMIKPMHEIYEYAISKFDIKPEESVFIDDLCANVAAARLCGLHGYVFYPYPDQLRVYLDDLLAGKEDKTGFPIKR